jgi:protoporphyrinogen oxidase
MKIGVIGAGFTGLSASYKLAKQGHDVIVFERDILPGGLALGFKEKEWDWTLEKHYHHWFTNDKAVLDLAKEINHTVITKRPKTSVFVDGKIYQFDSPKEVLLFPKLSVIDRIRMGAVIGLLKIDPIWKPLEKINATKFLPKTLGKRGYKMIWEPLFLNKFGPFANDVSLAWFWARIVKRTANLAYPQGGFLDFANHLVKEIEHKGGIIKYNADVKEVSGNKRIIIKVKEANKIKSYEFDKVIFTLPSYLFLSITKGLPQNYKSKFSKLNGLGATNLVLRLRKPFFQDNTYWLSVCDKKSPIMAIVEHTNFMNKKNYNDEYLIYLGNYLTADSNRFKMNKEEVLKLFDPFLKSINPNYKKSLIDYELFKAPFAQPIIPTNYSKLIPSMKTPIKNVYLANIEQVYPWDRGTNYAVELGEKIADYIFNEN